jgi:hypothetical protein
VKPEPERGEKRRIDPAERALGESGREVVGRAPALDGAVGERLGMGAIAPFEAEPIGR